MFFSRLLLLLFSSYRLYTFLPVVSHLVVLLPPYFFSSLHATFSYYCIYFLSSIPASCVPCHHYSLLFLRILHHLSIILFLHCALPFCSSFLCPVHFTFLPFVLIRPYYFSFCLSLNFQPILVIADVLSALCLSFLLLLFVPCFLLLRCTVSFFFSVSVTLFPFDPSLLPSCPLPQLSSLSSLVPTPVPYSFLQLSEPFLGSLVHFPVCPFFFPIWFLPFSLPMLPCISAFLLLVMLLHTFFPIPWPFLLLPSHYLSLPTFSSFNYVLFLIFAYFFSSYCLLPYCL